MEFTFIFIYLIILVSAVFHEYAHGWAAFELGDDTARRAGRLTLNPLAHIEIFGTVILPLLLMFSSGIFIGWAKPVPYNPYNLKDRRYGSLKVALAGPAANLIIALILGLFIRFFSSPLVIHSFLAPAAVSFLELAVYINIVLAIFNLIPVPPLDGSKIAATLYPNIFHSFYKLGFAGIFLALFVAFIFVPPISQTIFYLIVGSPVSF